LNELADLRRLKIGERHSIRSLWPQESRIKLGDLHEAPVFDCLQILKRPVIAPPAARPPLFVDREAFGKPSRYPVVGHLKRYDVSELVPQSAAPVELTRIPRGRAVHRNHLSKTNPKRTQSRQSQRPHRKVFVICKNLSGNRRARSEVVLCAQRLECFVEKL